VKFKEVVNVTEFSRRLGGDVVPGDGTIVTMSLGKPVARTTIPLAAEPSPGRPSIEERAWVPCHERVKLLKKAMGAKRYFASWHRHRYLIQQIRASRKRTNADKVDFQYMPTSLREAQERAKKISSEVKVQPACGDKLGEQDKLIRRVDNESKGHKKAGTLRKIVLKHSQPQFGTPKKIRQGNTGIGTSSVTRCHRCSQPIGITINGARCVCLFASPQSLSKKFRRQSARQSKGAEADFWL
jgi:hypothetical protein